MKMKITKNQNETCTTNLNLIKILGIFGILGIILISGCVEEKQNKYDQPQNITYKEPTEDKPDKPSVPMNVNLSIDENLQLNQEARLVFTVTPIVNINGAPSTTIQISLPDEFKLISGETFWKGDINKDETVKLDCIIKPIKEGFYIIKATAISNQGKYKFGKSDTLYINISKDNVTISHSDPKHKRVRENITYAQRINIPEHEIKNITTPKHIPSPAPAPETINNVVNANNQFAFELYSKFSKEKEGNIFFSPYSISTALAMTYEGARGKTAEEMQSVLHFPEDNTTRRTAFSKIINQINKENKDYELNTANALWAQKNYKFLDEYFNTIEQYYGGKVTNLDFVDELKREKSRVTINSWVENQTNNKIKNLIPKGVLNEMTRLVLTNAIYFKGNWAEQFDKKNTREAEFKVNSEKLVKVQMMSLTDEFNYTETENLQILELPYEGDELSMLILLPKDDDLKTLEKSLNVEKLNELKNNLREQEVNVFIPRFKFETKYFMKETLSEMGMPTAFTWPGADFSGMDDTKDLFISSVIHQAFVEVNEEGTEAAAATAVVMECGGIPMPTAFRADHPFIFIIQDKETGSILFLGKVVDPTQNQN